MRMQPLLNKDLIVGFHAIEFPTFIFIIVMITPRQLHHDPTF